MATITSSGSVSGLDVNSLVTQLVAAERAAPDARLAKVDTRLTTQFTALSQLKGSMAAFQASLAGLKDASKLVVRKAVVSDDTRLAATASATASSGAYDVEVMQLAKATQLRSAAYVGGSTTVVGTGTLTLSLGSSIFTVAIDSTKNTLAGIRDAINKSANNTGVRATILTGADGAHLVLTGDKTGLANAVTVTQSGGDGGLAQLVYDPPTTSGYTVVAAQDAIVNLSGIEVRSATNSIDGAIDGVTLTLKKATPGTIDTLSVTNDDAAVQKKASDFVTAYNALGSQIAKLRSYDAATKKAGPMLGDSMLLNIETQVRRLVSGPVTGATSPYTTLASVGIAFGTDGNLALDAAKFQTAMTANSTAVSQLFGSTNGVATQMDKYLESQLSTSGAIAARTAGIDVQRKDLVSRQDALNARMVVYQARYQKQFTALDSMLSQLQSTSSYLTQQLAQSTSIAKSAGT
ncbi:MAG: flagellar filament capping protein FliD [Steroidobacteraceae bacterium]